MSVRYYEGAARAAADDFHAAGQQPMHEMNRLSDDVADAAAGQVGGDDERLQHQLLLAEQGHLPAMVATSAASAESSASSLERVAIAMAEEVLDEPAAAALMCCLLYTSPSPRDGLLSRMPSSA